MAARTRKMKPAYLPLLFACLAMAACTPEQLYATGRNAQRTECIKLPDDRDRARCLKDAETSYGTYKRQGGDPL